MSDIRSPFFTDVGRAVEDVAYRHGLRLILCNTDEDPTKEQSYLELMADEQASGVIISPTLEGLERLRGSDWPFPMVTVDRARGDLPIDQVLLDNRRAGRQLAEHLLQAGYRDIAVLAGTPADLITGQADSVQFSSVQFSSVQFSSVQNPGIALLIAQQISRK